MAETTTISWTDHTWSPWHGCVKVSPGCFNCYAETRSKRFGFDIWGPASNTSRRMMSEPHWKQPYRWNRQAGGEGEMRRVFPSMCDPFELHPQVTAPRERMFEMIRHTHWLNWLLLTKRPENIDMLLPAGKWHNVWLGVSTEDQVRANERVPQLLQLRDRVPVLFLSVEPQIGPVTLKPWIDQLDWVIPGGESGAHHRPFDLAWARTLRDECKVAGVAFHFKQVGGRTHAEGGCLLDGREYKEFPAA